MSIGLDGWAMMPPVSNNNEAHVIVLNVYTVWLFTNAHHTYIYSVFCGFSLERQEGNFLHSDDAFSEGGCIYIENCDALPYYSSWFALCRWGLACYAKNSAEESPGTVITWGGCGGMQVVWVLISCLLGIDFHQYSHHLTNPRYCSWAGPDVEIP